MRENVCDESHRFKPDMTNPDCQRTILPSADKQIVNGQPTGVSVDGLYALTPQFFDTVFHVFELLGRMPLPCPHLAHNAQRLLCAIGFGGLPGNFLSVRLGSSMIGPVGSTM